MEEQPQKLTLRNKLGMAHAAGMSVGAKTFVDNYDSYRRWSVFIFIVALVVSIIFGRDDLALISFGFIHLHILFNQLWWKLKNIEHYYMEKQNDPGKA